MHDFMAGKRRGISDDFYDHFRGGGIPGECEYSFVGTAAFGPREFGQISATLMVAVYIGQALASPLMAALLTTEGGMGLAWKVFAATTASGMILLVTALKMSPMEKQ